MTMALAPVGHGAVYDRGYRPATAVRPRASGGAATMALWRASIRRALGLRRSWRQKVAPFVLLAVVTLPAVINVGIGYVTRDRVVNRIEIVNYRDYVGVSSALLLFVAIIAPDVMCPDRRQRVLPLMFARPLTGLDYVVAKFGAIASIMVAFSLLPQMVLFLGNMLVSDSALDYLTGHLDMLWKVPAAVLVLAVYYAIVGVAVSSLTDRRIVAGTCIIGIFLVTSIAAGIIVGDNYRRLGGSPAAVINVLALPLYLRDVIFLGMVGPALAAQRGAQRWTARPRRVPRRAGDRVGDPAVALPLGGAMSERVLASDGLLLMVLRGDPDAPSHDSLVHRRLPPRPTLPRRHGRPAVDERRRPGVRRRANRRDQRRVGVVRRQGGAVRAELLVRRRRHRAARAERSRQDDVDAGHHRHEPGQPGVGPGRRSRPAT